MNRRQIPFALILVFGALFALMAILGSSTPVGKIPNSRLVFDRPASWREADRTRVLDPAWAAEQKQLYPNDAALVDAMVEAFRSGRIDYYAFIELDGNVAEADGWVEGSVVQRDAGAATLADVARASVDRQPVTVLPGTSAVNAPLPIGQAVRLDWSYELLYNDGSTQTVYIRSYWLQDGNSTIAIQLGTYGARPDVVANFDAVANTFRWGN